MGTSAVKQKSDEKMCEENECEYESTFKNSMNRICIAPRLAGGGAGACLPWMQCGRNDVVQNFLFWRAGI